MSIGVYIKGMEMPATCQECEFAVPGVDSAYCERHEKTAMDFSVAENGRPNWCPLVEVPPNGRLIDADLLGKILKDRAEDEWNKNTAPFSWSYAYECLIDTLDSMPTIIEAEEEK